MKNKYTILNISTGTYFKRIGNPYINYNIYFSNILETTIIGYKEAKYRLDFIYKNEYKYITIIIENNNKISHSKIFIQKADFEIIKIK